MSDARRIVRIVAAAIPVAAVLVFGDVAPGMAGKEPDGSEKVVARVGDAVITVGEMERRLAAVPPFQLRAYGSTREEIKRNFLEKVLIPEVLFARGAKERGKDEQLEVRARRRDLLKTALLLDIREKTAEEAKISREEIESYYKENIQRFKTPARVSVWRILVSTRDKAEEIIAKAKKTPTPKVWSELAREHSLDKSTSMRGGNLGFLTEKGVSTDAKTRVPEAVAKAAFGVRDGEIVGEPIPEGSGFAVVWRRGSMPAIGRTVEEEAGAIAKTLLREKTREAQQSLTEELRKRYVTMVHPDGAELIAVTGGGNIELEGKPGRIVRRSGRTHPSPTPRGLR